MQDNFVNWSPKGVVDTILAVQGFRARLDAIRELRATFSPELAERFRTGAQGIVRSDPHEAGQRAQLGALVATEIDYHRGVSTCLLAYAGSAILRGKYSAALRSLKRAENAGRSAGDTETDPRIDALRLQTLIHLERYEAAKELGERLLGNAQAQDDERGEVKTRMALADLAFRMDRPREALRHYARIDPLLGPDTSDRVRGALAVNRANALEACNRFRAASRHFETARRLFYAEGCHHTVAQVDYNNAYAEFLRGRYDDALRLYARTETEFSRLQDERHLAHIDLDRAEIHLHLNLPDDARGYAATAEKRFTHLGLAKERAQAMHLSGRAAELSGDLASALFDYARAEDDFERLGLTERRFRCMVQRACVAERAGALDLAWWLADEAEALLSDGMNPLSQASVDLLRARLDLRAGRPEDALARAEHVLTRCRRIHAPWVLLEAQRIAGRAHVASGNLDAAIVAYRRAIDHLENYRGGVPPDEFMTAFLAGRSGLYSDVVALLVQAGDENGAFEYTERAKSRALVDLLAGRRQHTNGAPSPDGPLALRAGHLRERLTAIYGRIFRNADEPDARSARAVNAARSEASELERELSRLLRDGRFEDDESTSLDTVVAPDLHEVRADLEPGTTLVEYFLTDDRLFTFVVGDGVARVLSTELREEDLRRRLERFHFHLSKFQRPMSPPEERVMPATRANLGELADMLVQPIAEWLAGKRLVIVPHGVLHHLPFHALPWGEGWLSDEFEIVYAPSAAVYGFCGRKDRPEGPGGASVFGLPDESAPHIEAESHRVAELLGTRALYLRDDATFDRLRSAAGSSRIVHIATHGMFRPKRPMLSAIRLADRWVNLYDLYGMEVTGDLVVLSTCESGIAGVSRGDEVLGLMRGFLYAGAPALLASQWRVNDAVTTEFMESFYRHLEELDDVAAAHREAMAELRSTHPHPYFWAPFFLTGRPVARLRREGSFAASAATNQVPSGTPEECPVGGQRT